MAKIPEIIADVNALIDADSPAWIWGKPGIGKSEIVREIAAERNADCRDIRLSTFDPVDLRGLPAIVDGLTQWLRPAIWPTDTTRETVLFFDEMDRAATAVANAALQIVLDRRIGEHVLPSTVRIVAAGNGATDRGTTTKIGLAQANRFTHLYAEADAEAAARHWSKLGYDPALVAFIRFRGERDPAKPGVAGLGLLETAPAEGEHAFASPRAWAECNKYAHLPLGQRMRLMAGRVGKAPALEFAAFAEMFASLPPISTILTNPTGAPVSDKINVNFAVSSALARKADQANFGAIVTYAERMPREFMVATVTDAARRDRGLCDHPAYAGWILKNQDVTL